MRIVLDTNILLACIHPKSQYFPIWKAFTDERFIIGLTTDIILEYAKILPKFYDNDTNEILLNQFNLQNNVRYVHRYFEWGLISIDPDDNKFVDCAIALNADFIVTNDKHFDVLKKVDFPKIKTVNALEFLKILS